MYKTKNLGLNITEMPQDTNSAFSFDLDLGDNFKAIDEKTISHRNITNCLLEVPQDIKLELVDGAAVLKAGSKVYIPNGDTTEEQEIYTDIINSTVGEGDVLLAVNKDGNLVAMKGQGYTVSERPESPIVLLLYHNTTTNRIEVNDGSTWYSGCSYPIAIATRTNTGFSRIKQVFNGFGYIGSTVFALPGVKGLIPDGRNEDGSLRNIEFATSKVSTHNISAGDKSVSVFFNSTGAIADGFNLIISDTPPSAAYRLYYKEKENELWNTNNNEPKRAYAVVFGEVTMTYTSGITSFTPKKPFRAVDYNDYQSKITELEAKIQTLQTAIEALQG